MSRRSQTLGFGLAAMVFVVAAALFAGAGVLPELGGSAPPVAVVRLIRKSFLRSVTADGFLRAVRATSLTVPPEVPGTQRVAWIAENGAFVRKGDIILKLDPTQMQRNLADGQSDRAIAEAKIAGARARTENGRASLLLDASQAEREMEQRAKFYSRDARIYSRHELIEGEIDRDLAKARAENARQRSEIVARQGKTELELLQIELAKADLQIRQAEKGLAALQLAAPHDGMLVLERNWRGEVVREGGDVWPSQKLAEIPDPSHMQAQCYVLEADAAGLAAGNLATLIVESRPNQRFTAKVERVDALAKKRQEQVPVQYFEVLLLPDQTDPQLMKPGQRVRAEIVLEEVEKALMVPRQAIVEKAGKTHAWLKQADGGFVLVPVKLGSQNLSHAMVLEGLAEGNEVALADPGIGGLQQQPQEAPTP